MLAVGMAMTLHVGLRAEPVERGLATPIEQALIEQACASTPAAPVDADRHEECLHARLDSLRADFGRDLGRLSTAERRTIDSACASIRAVQGRDGYVNCLASQLVVLRNRRSRGASATPDPSQAADRPSAAEATTPTVAAENPPQRSSRVSLLVTSAAGVCALFCGGALVVRARLRRRACKTCGARIGDSGDLCAVCRHQAAEALRRAAAERADLQRAQDDEVRRQREREEEQQRRLAREAEDARLHQQELERRREEEAAEQARRREAEAAERNQRAAAENVEAAFDPYAVLGVSRDVTRDALHEAYTQAKARYDLEEVAGLGLEVREHYLAKAEAVERAFQMLAATLNPETAPEAAVS